MSEVVFERLKLNKEEEYVDFLMEAYREQFNYHRFRDREFVKRFWRWEYVENPAASSENPYIWICRRRGKIIARICFMPVRLSVKGRTYKGCWCQDLMVLSELRSMGMGYFLIRHALGELAGSVDLVMVSGTNSDSYALFKNSGFIDLGFIGRNIKPALFGSAAYRRSGLMDSLDISEVQHFDERFDRLWHEVSGKISCAVVRDKATLAWRFDQNPYLKYNILAAEKDALLKGYVVFRKDTLKRGALSGLRIGIISDIFFDPADRDVGALLLSRAIQHMGKDVKIFRCDILCEAIYPVIRSAGFFSIKSNNRFLVHPITKGLDEVVESAGEWYLTYGDSDLDLS